MLSIGWSSQGRRPTATASRVDLAAIAAGCGVPYTVDVTAEDELDAEIELVFSRNVCSFINVRTRPGHSHVRPRRKSSVAASSPGSGIPWAARACT